MFSCGDRRSRLLIVDEYNYLNLSDIFVKIGIDIGQHT